MEATPLGAPSRIHNQVQRGRSKLEPEARLLCDIQAVENRQVVIRLFLCLPDADVVWLLTLFAFGLAVLIYRLSISIIEIWRS